MLKRWKAGPPSCRTWTNWRNENWKNSGRAEPYQIQQGEMPSPVQGTEEPLQEHHLGTG